MVALLVCFVGAVSMDPSHGAPFEYGIFVDNSVYETNMGPQGLLADVVFVSSGGAGAAYFEAQVLAEASNYSGIGCDTDDNELGSAYCDIHWRKFYYWRTRQTQGAGVVGVYESAFMGEGETFDYPMVHLVKLPNPWSGGTVYRFVLDPWSEGQMDVDFIDFMEMLRTSRVACTSCNWEDESAVDWRCTVEELSDSYLRWIAQTGADAVYGNGTMIADFLAMVDARFPEGYRVPWWIFQMWASLGSGEMLQWSATWGPFDHDGDGWSDEWERYWNYDPYNTFDRPNDVDADGCLDVHDADIDGDGVANYLDANDDGDYYSDEEERSHGMRSWDAIEHPVWNAEDARDGNGVELWGSGSTNRTMPCTFKYTFPYNRPELGLLGSEYVTSGCVGYPDEPEMAPGQGFSMPEPDTVWGGDVGATRGRTLLQLVPQYESYEDMPYRAEYYALPESQTWAPGWGSGFPTDWQDEWAQNNADELSGVMNDWNNGMEAVYGGELPEVNAVGSPSSAELSANRLQLQGAIDWWDAATWKGNLMPTGIVNRTFSIPFPWVDGTTKVFTFDLLPDTSTAWGQALEYGRVAHRTFWMACFTMWFFTGLVVMIRQW